MKIPAVKPAIVVVDDDPICLKIVESILARDYSLKLFHKCKAALDYAVSHPPDLILLDILMPDMDGFQACRLIRENPELANTPVIFITSKNDAEYISYGYSVGASDYLLKPIDASVLIAMIDKHVKNNIAE
jgi:DNA-binding response OmpR family regulator